MPIKGQSPKETIHTEMKKFKEKSLHSGSKHGPLVQNRKQAIAIALSEARKASKKAGGGKVKARQPRDEDVEDRRNEVYQYGRVPPHEYPPYLGSGHADNVLSDQLGAGDLDKMYPPNFAERFDQRLDHTPWTGMGDLTSAMLNKSAQMRGDATAPAFAGGGDVDDPDQQAMMPETFQNPLVKHMASGAAEQAAVPGQVMTPNPYPAGSEEADWYERQRQEGSEDWARSQALGMIGGSGAFPARPGELRTGVGIKSRTVDATKLGMFQDLEAQGVSPAQNYTRTGWYRDEDGKARYWIDDSNAQLKPDAFNHYFDQRGNRHITMFDPDDYTSITTTKKLGDIWDHPELYEAHPWLANADVVEHDTKSMGGNRGYYNPIEHTINVRAQPPEEFHNTLHHEVIHAIQHEEGFANGGDFQQFLPKDHNQRVAEAQSAVSKVMGQIGYNLKGLTVNDLKDLTYRNLKDLNPIEKGLRTSIREKGLWDDWKTAVDKFTQASKDQTDAFQKYLHLSGESEARTGPYLRENPDAIKPYQIPKHINPEIKSSKKVTPSAPIADIWPGPSTRWGNGPEAELPEGFVPDGVYEPEHRAEGGMAKKKHTQIDEDPQEHEFINFAKGGLIDSHIPGRTDKIPMRVMPGSYVLPADIPSALGQGNSKAGAEILKKMFTHSAYGLPPPNIHGHAFQFPHMHFPHKARGGKVEAAKVLPANHQLGMKVPKGGSMCANCEYFKAPQSCGNKGFQQWNGEAKLPHPANEYCCDLYEHEKAEKKADGGATETTPIIAAGGEFIIHPDVVKAVGDGDMKKGHKVLDQFVIKTRKQHIDTLKSLKPPK